MTPKTPGVARASLLFAVAFLLTNVVNSAFTLTYQSVVRLPPADEIGEIWLNDPAYQATVPWHALIVFLIFAATAFWLRLGPADHRRAWLIGLGWAIASILIDAVVYVVILGQTRWGLPAADFYIGNQPWITLSYLGVLVAPASAMFVRSLTRGPAQFSS